MATKADRQAAILQMIGAEDIRSQEELRARLARRGISVTQATLSRDLREMGVARVPGEDGPRYALPETIAAEASPALETILPQMFSRVDGVGELVVLHTVASGAQPVSEALDAAGWREVLGTVAGDDTILVVCRSAQARQEVIRRISRIALGPGAQ